MTTHIGDHRLIAAFLFLTQCGPETSDDSVLDPEETFTAFCETLFLCPEVDAMGYYGSQEGCEDVHRADHQERDQVCREIVLMLEDCLAELTCLELEDNGCSDLRTRLGQEGCRPL